jgi:hypothetical protein
MKKLFYIIILIILSEGAIAQLNNRTRQASCQSGSRSRLYITPYIGAGGSSYSYKLNNTVMDADSNFYNDEGGRLFSPIVGINLMYNIGKSNLGGGFEWQGMYGKTNNGLFETSRNIYFYKFYGRYEYAIYKDSFFDFGLYLEGGLLFPKNVEGDAVSMGGFGKAGIFYNIIINSTSSLFIGLDYQYLSFNSTIGQPISTHVSKDLKLNIGYRFWFD